MGIYMGNIIATEPSDNSPTKDKENNNNVVNEEEKESPQDHGPTNEPTEIDLKLEKIKNVVDEQNINSDDLLDTMKSVTSLCKYLWFKYHELFLQKDACNNIALVVSDKLAKLEASDLKTMYSYINSNKSNTSIGAYLQYNPANQTQLIVEDMAEDLQDYFYDKRVELNKKLYIKNYKYI